jgi:ankyrin repeat protein
MCAINAENMETVTLLLKSHADVNAVDDRQGTGLHLAALTDKSCSMTQLLLRRNADTDLTDGIGLTVEAIGAVVGAIVGAGGVVLLQLRVIWNPILLSTRKADRSKRPRPEATMSRKNGAVNARPRQNSPCNRQYCQHSRREGCSNFQGGMRSHPPDDVEPTISGD